MSRTDRAIGIALGLLIGIAALIIFVFLGSESAIDAPSIDTPTQTMTTTTGEGP